MVMEYSYPILSSINKANLTPMMEQYLNTKLNYMDSLLFYRMGDFYELFFDDAIIAAKDLDIALTKRGTADGEGIAMCGVPHHSSISYLNRLIKSGHKVAICEQMETPEQAKKRGYKAVVKREVTRVITPATINEDNLLEQNKNSYLLSIALYRGQFALAYVDISNGEFLLSLADINTLAAEITRINPNEIIASDSIYNDHANRDILRNYTKNLSLLDDSKFSARNASAIFNDYFESGNINALENFNESQKSAICGAIEYLKLTQIESKPRLSFPKVLKNENYIFMGASTRANLELTQTLQGEYKGSVLHAINRTTNNMGARLLSSYLANPLIDAQSIKARQEVVSFFYSQDELLGVLRNQLNEIPDLERALARICVGRAGVNDLVMVRKSLQQFLPISGLLLEQAGQQPPARLKNILSNLGDFTDLLNLLKIALFDEPSFDKSSGNYIRDGYSAELDEYRRLQNESKKILEELEKKYREQTGINNLKIKENNVLGTFIEIKPADVANMTDEFVHRQGLASAVRYTSEELRKTEQKIISAKSNALQLELEIYTMLCDTIITLADSIALAGNAIAELDVLSSFANLAIEQDYSLPEINDSKNFTLEGAKHPVISQGLDDFIANDIELDDKKIVLLTGPNMAGKSTYLRQNALIIILTQIGCYVPARKANIGIVDKLYSRVGASDNLAKGQSTFMVEMLETAEILNTATEKSFIILDEIGRGTATYDGLSIAWAVLENLNNNIKARCIFATHYHELTTLEAELGLLKSNKMEVREHEGKIIFTHKVKSGKADKSYGINVAELAGISKNITARAEDILGSLENKKIKIKKASNVLPLFEAPKKSEIELEIENLNPDNLTPKEALDFLYSLKSKPEAHRNS